MDFAVVQIGSRQYLAAPNQVIKVDKLPTKEKTLVCEKVLLLSEDGKVEIGKPYLKRSLNFEILGHIKGPKIRVATYKAKSNFRRVKGQRWETTGIKLIEKVEGKKINKPVKKS